MKEFSDRLSFRPGRVVREDLLVQGLFVVGFGEAIIGAVDRKEDV